MRLYAIEWLRDDRTPHNPRQFGGQIRDEESSVLCWRKPEHARQVAGGYGMQFRTIALEEVEDE